MPIMVPPGSGVTTTTPVGQVTTPSNVAAQQVAATAGPPRQQAHPSPFRPTHGPDLVIMPHQDDPAPPAQSPSPPQQPAQPTQLSRARLALRRGRT